MGNEELSGDLTEFEQQLRGLAVRPSSLDRDRFMFLAGQESVRAQPTPRAGSWLWPLATVLSLATTVLLALRLNDAGDRAVVERIVYQNGLSDVTERIPPSSMPPRESPANEPRQHPFDSESAHVVAQDGIKYSTSAQVLLRTRDVALRFGVEALPGTLAIADQRLPRDAQQTRGELLQTFSRELGDNRN